MRKLEEALNHLLNLAKEYQPERKEKEIKISRKKYSLYYRVYNSQPYISIFNSHSGTLTFSEDKGLESYRESFDEFLFVLKWMNKEELTERFKENVLKFTKKEVDAAVEKETHARENFKSSFENAISPLLIKNESSLKIGLGKCEYRLRYRKPETDQRMISGFIELAHSSGLSVTTTDYSHWYGIIDSAEHLIFGDVLRSLKMLSAEEVNEWHQNGSIKLEYAKKIKPSFEHRFALLLERRNDYKILHQMFGEEKYENKWRRINTFIKRYQRIAANH